jgi:hypothetical protein
MPHLHEVMAADLGIVPVLPEGGSVN